MLRYLIDRAGAFDSDEIAMMSTALDQAWATIQRSGAVSPDDSDDVRAALAKHIIDATTQGERDVGKLVEIALAGLTGKRV